MAKVLTESEVAAIGGTSTSYGNRCCTKARAEELGCTVTEPSDAVSNQLITGVSKAQTDYVTIAGVKWATEDLSGSYNNLYFQWASIEGRNEGAIQGLFPAYWGNYVYDNGSTAPGAAGMTKYNLSDGKRTIETGDDAAYVRLQGKYRIPTPDEVTSLINNTTHQWMTNYQNQGISGMLFTDKTDSSKTLFFQAKGIAQNKNINSKGVGCFFWTNQIYGNDVQTGRYMYCSSAECRLGYYSRCYGMPIRPVYIG